MRNIEALVAIGRRRLASEILQTITTDSKMSTWDLGTSLYKFQEPADANPILDAA